jgi:uncharacterized membrane protein
MENMFCLKCGNQIPDGATFCPACGEKSAPAAAPAPQPQAAPQYQAPVPPPQPQYQQPVQPQQYQQPQYQAPYQQPVAKADNSKIYKILSYVGILWLIGMFVTPEKDNPSVRFHVGQGIILTIVTVALSIVSAIFNAILSAVAVVEVTRTVWGIPYTDVGVAPWASVITTIVSLAVSAVSIILLVMGIMNVTKGKDEPLPIIGKFAFYK